MDRMNKWIKITIIALAFGVVAGVAFSFGFLFGLEMAAKWQANTAPVVGER